MFPNPLSKPTTVKKLLFLFALVLVLALAVFFWWPLKPIVRLAMPRWAGFAPIILADKLGIFQKHGLRVKILFASGPVEANKWFREGKADLVAVPLADLIHLRASGYRTKAIMITDYSLEADSIVGLPELDSLQSLKGKTVGIDGLNSFSHLFVLRLLQQAGLTERDVQFKVINYDQVLQALKKKEVDAAHTWEPALSESLNHGYKRLGSARDLPGSIWDSVGVSESYLRKHPEVSQKFFSAFHAAHKLLIANPDAAAKTVLQVFLGNPEDFKKELRRLHFVTEDEHARWSSEGKEGLSFEKQARLINEFYLKRGQTRKSDLYKEIMVEK